MFVAASRESAYARFLVRGVLAVVRMAEVAGLAGVSTSTVSHVLNGTRRVRPETEAAVRAAIESTGYIHDTIARSLVTGGTMTVGVAMSAISNPYFADSLHAIEQALTLAGYSVLLAETHDNSHKEQQAVASLLSRRVDALILAASDDPSRALASAARAKVPVVLIDRVIDADLDQVGCVNVAPTAQLVDHLADHGHRRIAMIAGRRGIATTEERIAGYRRGLRRHGLRFDPEMLAAGDGSDVQAERAVRNLLSLGFPPSALIVGNNLMTVGAMAGLRGAGVDVPGDLALVAFDDFAWADLFSPRLTTIAQPTQQIGERAVAMLLARVADPERPARTVRLKPTFVHRDSCGCAAGER
jgi:LacI family transcriptional regulator